MAAVIGAGFTSCSDDDFGPSIFDTTESSLDRTSYTFPLDTFIKVNFLEPYNLRYAYKMEDISTDMDYNLVPASYDVSAKLAVLCKYLWYDVYKKCISEEFLKIYSPRIIMVVGSKAYNPSTGSETLGVTEGGRKITLYNANNLNPADIENLNEYFFHTMHHEFSHILAQNVATPTAFNLISNGQYNPNDWTDTPDSVALGQGFISNYASSASIEDWVEIISRYITTDYKTWNGMIESAHYDWEKVEGYDASAYNKAVAQGADRDTLGYKFKVSAYDTNGSEYSYTIQRKLIQRDESGTAVLDADGKPQFLNENGIDGGAVILQKLELAKSWLKENFNIDIDELRDEVQKRQWVTDENGNLAVDADGNYINHFTQPLTDDPSRTFMDELLDEINQYKELQK